MGTVRLRSQLGGSELICFQSWLSNNEWAKAAIFSQNLPTAVEEKFKDLAPWEGLRQIRDRVEEMC